MTLAIIFGVATAVSNALGLVAQHIASVSNGNPPKGWRFVLHLVRQPLWLAGWLGLAGSLIFQTLALHFGPMSVVQPLLVSELVVALLVRKFGLRQPISSAAWLYAGGTVVSLSLFLTAAAPDAGHPPANHNWVISGLWCTAVTVLAVAATWRGSPRRRAAGFAVATAIAWAFEATLIKTVSDVWTSFGLHGLLTNWAFYLFIVVGVSGLLFEQTALHVGPLSVSQPLIVLGDPSVSLILGVTLLSERFHGGLGGHVLAITAFVATCGAALQLMRHTPQSMGPAGN